MRKRILVIMAFWCMFLTACENKETNQKNEVIEEESVIKDSQEELLTTDKSDNVIEEFEENAAPVELVDVNKFLEYYQMQEADVPTEYIVAFIQHRHLTEEMLAERNYDKMVKELYDRGVTFGNKISDLISGEQILLLEEDSFADVTYIVLCKEINLQGTDMCTEENIVLEVENQKIYITPKSVTDDYTTEQNVKEISEQDVKECLQELRGTITEEWEKFHSIEGRTYGWRLYIVKQDGSLISYEGEGVDEKYHPGFEQWCQKYFH